MARAATIDFKQDQSGRMAGSSKRGDSPNISAARAAAVTAEPFDDPMPELATTSRFLNAIYGSPNADAWESTRASAATRLSKLGIRTPTRHWGAA
jgi:hypothetical protein